jgi:hypothetical protein
MDMTRLRRVAVALLLALPIEAGNLCLAPMMFDPGPFPTGIVSRLLQAEWVFFHFVGISMIDLLHKVLGTEKAGLLAAFILAYLQTALLLFLFMEVVRRFRGRPSLVSQVSPAYSL